MFSGVNTSGRTRHSYPTFLRAFSHGNNEKRQHQVANVGFWLWMRWSRERENTCAVRYDYLRFLKKTKKQLTARWLIGNFWAVNDIRAAFHTLARWLIRVYIRIYRNSWRHRQQHPHSEGTALMIEALSHPSIHVYKLAAPSSLSVPLIQTLKLRPTVHGTIHKTGSSLPARTSSSAWDDQVSDIRRSSLGSSWIYITHSKG